MKDFAETIANALVLALVGALIMLALFSCAHPDPVLTPLRVWDPPACIVVLGPPPAPPMEYRELPRCASPGVAPDEPCLTAAQSNILARWAAQTQLYALGAYRACQVSDEGVTDDVRTLN